MKFKHIVGLLSAAAMSVVLAGRRVGPGQDRQDRRDLSPERQRGQRRRARQGGDRDRGRDHQQRQSCARQSAGDEECRPQGSRRRQGRSRVRRQPGQPRGRAEPGASPDHRREGGCAHRRLSVRHHADDERDRREIRHSLRQRRVGRGQPHRARLQMVLPDDAGGRRFRQDLSRLPQGHEGRRAEDRQRRASCTRTPNTAPRSRASSPACSRRTASPIAPGYRLLGQHHRRAEPGAAAQGQEAGRRDHDQLHVGRDPLRQDDAGAGLQAADDDRRQCRLLRSVDDQGRRKADPGPVQSLVLCDRHLRDRRPS